MYAKEPMEYQEELRDVLRQDSIHNQRLKTPIKDRRTKEKWDNILLKLFVFSIVRNPWSRLVSAYKQAQTWCDPDISEKKKEKLLRRERNRPHPEKRLTFEAICNF